MSVVHFAVAGTAFVARTIRSALLTAAALGAASGAHGEAPPNATDAQRLPPVEVSTLRDPVAKSYRRIVRGLELFERRRELAPAAVLRFRLLPRQPDTDMHAVALRIVGESFGIAVPVAADGTFTIPRNARALEEDALVVPNRRAGSLTWRADIRSPGVPPGARRLGDLRLECLVGMESGLISDYPASLLDGVASLFAGGSECARPASRYFFFAERPVWTVTLSHGSRREAVPVDRLYAGATRRPITAADLRYCDCAVLLDRTYFAPLGDASWPDDTLLTFEFMDDP